MGHQPFENWLLSEETLPPQQARDLREHLRECEACRQIEASWTGVRQLIRSTPAAAPKAGFIARWQARLEEQQRKRHRRQSLLALGLNGSIAAILLVGILVQITDMLRAPGQFMNAVVYRLFALWVYADTTSEVLLSAWRSFLPAVPLPLWIFVPGIMSFLLVLWIFSYKQLISARRITL